MSKVTLFNGHCSVCTHWKLEILSAGAPNFVRVKVF